MNEKPSADSSLSLQLWRIVTIAGALTCATTLLGFAGQQSWFLDLFSHFRVQYLVLLTLSGIVLLAARHHKTAALFLVFALINLSGRIVFPIKEKSADTRKITSKYHQRTLP